MIYEVIFDVETKKWFDNVERNDPALLGVSIISLYERELDDNFKEIRGEIKSYWEKDFNKMWPIFEKAHRIIGFNTLKFDVPSLKPYSPPHFSKLPHFDILDQIKRTTGHRISLNAIAKETLGKHKIDSGANAVLYWNKGDVKSLTLLQKYCEEDVRITKEIYDFIRVNKYVKFKDHWNTIRKVTMDFSYPVQKQAGLF